jgi:nicotinamidase-related amidase
MIVTRRRLLSAMVGGVVAAPLAAGATIQKGNPRMSKTGLLLIDVQNDYFQDGRFPLEGMEAASVQAARLLAAFRRAGLPVIHVRHENPSAEAPFFRPGTAGAEIHASVAPEGDESVVVKQHPNSFLGTNLGELLDARGIRRLAIVGAMSNMCIDAGTRAAADLGYECLVAEDACAAMTIAFQGTTVPARSVHAAFMGALGLGYAKVAAASALLDQLGLA